MFLDWERHRLIGSDRQRLRAGILSLGEGLSIMVLFHVSSYKTFKDFWFYEVEKEYRSYYNKLPIYERFVALMPRLLLPSYLLLHWFSGEQSGIYFVDSTKLAVCHNARGRQHKVLRRMAQWGRSSMGWFFGLKLHLMINNQGQIMVLWITTPMSMTGQPPGGTGCWPPGQDVWRSGLHLLGDDATALAA